MAAKFLAKRIRVHTESRAPYLIRPNHQSQ